MATARIFALRPLRDFPAIWLDGVYRWFAKMNRVKGSRPTSADEAAIATLASETQLSHVVVREVYERILAQLKAEARSWTETAGD